MNNELLFSQHRVYFDNGDSRNGSLYLCVPNASGEQCPDVAIRHLRERGLWSANGLAEVEDEQRQAYIEQLQLLDYREYAEARLVAARCDHSRYPSDAARWQEWLCCLDSPDILEPGDNQE